MWGCGGVSAMTSSEHDSSGKDLPVNFLLTETLYLTHISLVLTAVISGGF